MKKKVKFLLLNLISYITILLVIEIFSGYFLQYRYSYKGFQIVELIKKFKFKLFRETKNKFFLDKPSKKFSKLIKVRKLNIKNVFPTYIYNPQLHNPEGTYWLTNPINSRVIFCEEKSGLIEFESNRFGLRSINDQDDQNNFKFIFVGDSITEGACVNDKSTIPSYFSFLRKDKVLNAGRSNSGPLFQLALATELLDYNNKIEKIFADEAKFIWITFAGNDLLNLVEEKTTLLSNYMKDGYSQDYFQNIDSLSEKQKIFLNEIVDLIENYGERSISYGKYGETSKYEWMAKRNKNIWMEVMKKFKERVENNGLKLKLVSITHKDAPKNSIMKISENFIDDNCQSLKIDCIKIAVPSNELNLNRTQMIDYHFTEEGYKSLAKIIDNLID